MKLGVPAVLREAPSKTGARRAGHWRYRQIGRLQAERESERAQFSVRSALPAILSRAKIFGKAAEQFANFCGELLARPRPNREAAAGPNAKSGKRNAPTANWTLLPKGGALALRMRASRSSLPECAARVAGAGMPIPEGDLYCPGRERQFPKKPSRTEFRLQPAPHGSFIPTNSFGLRKAPGFSRSKLPVRRSRNALPHHRVQIFRWSSASRCKISVRKRRSRAANSAMANSRSAN